ncbi:MAG: stage II sporulation protein P, partial [Lachnospiraceae bacterium]|nr:stage II sporulation protein P [Lachnospiraceae bacterium]
ETAGEASGTEHEGEASETEMAEEGSEAGNLEAGDPGTENAETETGEEEASGTESEGEGPETGDSEADHSGTEYPETEEAETETEIREALSLSEKQLEQLQDFDYLLNHYFVVDTDTVTDEMQLDASVLLEKDLSIEKNPDVPQILIYHTHSQEAFLDSVEGDTSTTIIGIGDYLAELLEKKYGYQVIHDTGVYDLVDGVLDRSAAYDYARASVEKILEENPTIEVIIDLHRDGVDGIHFVTEENGKSTAKIMFFNGLSKDCLGQPLDYLYNPYIEENLAFSFQLQLAAQQYYPDFTRNIYLKGQRFNLHLRPRSLLVEAGTQLNTVEEEKNAMEPLADILNEVLSGNNH